MTGQFYHVMLEDTETFPEIFPTDDEYDSAMVQIYSAVGGRIEMELRLRGLSCDPLDSGRRSQAAHTKLECDDDE